MNRSLGVRVLTSSSMRRNPTLRLGGWFWETGFDKDPIKDVEWMRDQNLRAMYGAWDALKNVDGQYPNHRLRWAAYIAGKRESRRLLGDVVLTGDDFRKDPEVRRWLFSLHVEHRSALAASGFSWARAKARSSFLRRRSTDKHYTYKGPYWAPYRCLYSRNVDNLFMAGRDISVSHEALGASAHDDHLRLHGRNCRHGGFDLHEGRLLAAGCV